MLYLPFAQARRLSDNQTVCKPATPWVLLAIVSFWTGIPVSYCQAQTNALANCAQCHVMKRGLSHPVDLAPTMSIPAYLPLQSGKITCITCHADSTAEPHATQEHDPMLRIDASRLCGQCHTDTTRSAKAMHALSFTRAHFSSSPRTTLSVARTLDDESRNCVGCHDGTLAAAVAVHATAGLDSAAALGDHPVGLAYPDDPTISSRSSGTSSFVSANRLDPRIRLFDGRVGCGSCHSPYSAEPKQLVISNSGSKLCLSCHVL